MKDVSNRIPNGLSWGMGGFFRVGKSVRGNWWISFRLPFGFRYIWMLGKTSKRNTSNTTPDKSSSSDHKNISYDQSPTHHIDVDNKEHRFTPQSVKSKIIKK